MVSCNGQYKWYDDMVMSNGRNNRSLQMTLK